MFLKLENGGTQGRTSVEDLGNWTHLYGIRQFFKYPDPKMYRQILCLVHNSPTLDEMVWNDTADYNPSLCVDQASNHRTKISG